MSVHYESGVVDLDISRLHRYLSGRIPGFIGPLKVHKLATGQSNPTYRLDTPRNDAYALRRKPFGKLPATAHAIEREYRVMKCLGETEQNVPVPKMILRCDNESIIGARFFVMQFLKGRTFSNPSLPELTKEERYRCYESILQALAGLHRVNYAKIGLEDWDRRGNYYKRQAKKLAQVSRHQANYTRPLADLECQTEWLMHNAPGGEQCLIHGDFKVDNFIFHPHKPQLIGIIDWEMSTVGHPLSDLATFVCMNQLSQTVTEMTDNGSTILTEEECLRKYCRFVRKDYSQQVWNYCKAFFYFKYSIIAQGVAARLTQGTASSQRADKVAQYVPLLSWLATSAMQDTTETREAKL